MSHFESAPLMYYMPKDDRAYLEIVLKIIQPVRAQRGGVGCQVRLRVARAPPQDEVGAAQAAHEELGGASTIAAVQTALAHCAEKKEDLPA